MVLPKITKPVQEVKKGWGKETWIHNDEDYCGKLLYLTKDKKCSLHYHEKKKETFYILKGKVKMELYEGFKNKEKFEMNEGDVLVLLQGTLHQFTGIEDSIILEISTQHFDSDSIRVSQGD